MSEAKPPQKLSRYEWYNSLYKSGRMVELSGTETKVLFCLGMYANNSTLECFPSRETIAVDIGIGVRNITLVRNALARLTELGFIETVTRGRGRGIPTIRKLIIQEPASKELIEKLYTPATKGVQAESKRGTSECPITEIKGVQTATKKGYKQQQKGYKQQQKGYMGMPPNYSSELLISKLPKEAPSENAGAFWLKFSEEHFEEFKEDSLVTIRQRVIDRLKLYGITLVAEKLVDKYPTAAKCILFTITRDEKAGKPVSKALACSFVAKAADLMNESKRTDVENGLFSDFEACETSEYPYGFDSEMFWDHINEGLVNGRHRTEKQQAAFDKETNLANERAHLAHPEDAEREPTFYDEREAKLKGKSNGRLLR